MLNIEHPGLYSNPNVTKIGSEWPLEGEIHFCINEVSRLCGGALKGRLFNSLKNFFLITNNSNITMIVVQYHWI
jgi:hypothetical protein